MNNLPKKEPVLATESNSNKRKKMPQRKTVEDVLPSEHHTGTLDAEDGSSMHRDSFDNNPDSTDDWNAEHNRSSRHK